jgi:hypothetical protein
MINFSRQILKRAALRPTRGEAALVVAQVLWIFPSQPSGRVFEGITGIGSKYFIKKMPRLQIGSSSRCNRKPKRANRVWRYYF